MKKNTWFVTVGVLGLSLMIYLGAVAQAEKNVDKDTISSGMNAGDFTLMDIDGKEHTLSEYKGNVVILDFWATWCPPCREEIPHFNDLAKKYNERGLVVLGVSVDRDGAEIVRNFRSEKQPLDYPVVMSNSEVYNKYQSYLPSDERGGIPFTFVIDKEGIIRNHYVGYRSLEVFEEAIKPLL